MFHRSQFPCQAVPRRSAGQRCDRTISRRCRHRVQSRIQDHPRGFPGAGITIVPLSAMHALPKAGRHMSCPAMATGPQEAVRLATPGAKADALQEHHCGPHATGCHHTLVVVGCIVRSSPVSFSPMERRGRLRGKCMDRSALHWFYASFSESRAAVPFAPCPSPRNPRTWTSSRMPKHDRGRNQLGSLTGGPRGTFGAG